MYLSQEFIKKIIKILNECFEVTKIIIQTFSLMFPANANRPTANFSLLSSAECTLISKNIFKIFVLSMIKRLVLYLPVGLI